MDAMNEQGKGYSPQGQPPTGGFNFCNMTNNTISISGSTCTVGVNQGNMPAVAPETDANDGDDAAESAPGKEAADNPPEKKPPPSGTPPKTGIGGLPLVGYNVIPVHEREITVEHARKNYASRWVFGKNRHMHDEPWEHQGFPDDENLQEYMVEIKQVRRHRRRRIGLEIGT